MQVTHWKICRNFSSLGLIFLLPPIYFLVYGYVREKVVAVFNSKGCSRVLKSDTGEREIRALFKMAQTYNLEKLQIVI